MEQLAACWAHARRKFYEIHEGTGSPIAAKPYVGSLPSMPSKSASRAVPLKSDG